MPAAVGVDVGGTFTDVVLVVQDSLHTAKVPSTADQSEGVMAGIEKACDEADIYPDAIEEFTHAMTVSVNALLERDGAKTALVTTEGFRDVLEIGRQTRPSLYDLDAQKPEPVVPRDRRFELDERVTTDGIERAVDEGEIQGLANQLAAEEVDAVAVSLLHAYREPENERQVAELLRETLEVPVSVSSEVLAEFREYERTATTAVDAYVRPSIDSYLRRLVDRATAAGVPRPRIMQANGGIADSETVRKRAVQTVLSGPAGGVVGAKRLAADLAAERDLEGLITFDMGGTSSDVSLVRDGTVERTTETEIEGHPIRVPMVDVTTVGSGGGSIAWVDAGGALRVGPESAGADPGPACYGRGGTEPTVTDANVVLGYIGEGTALGGELTLDVDAARTALGDLAARADLEDATEAAEGVIRVANATMIRAMRSVTVEQGLDPRDYGLVAFGGAGPMHATAVAEGLDIDTVVVPLASGVLSAYGLLDADERHDAVRTHRVALEDADVATLESIYEALADSATAEIGADATPTVERFADLRYRGQSFELNVPAPGDLALGALRERFVEAHERVYGYTLDAPVDLVNLRVTAEAPRSAPDATYEPSAAGGRVRERTAVFDGEGHETAIRDRRALQPGKRVAGPTVLEQAESTAVVPPGWAGEVGQDGTLVITRVGTDPSGELEPEARGTER